jgi:hypothetical protein
MEENQDQESQPNNQLLSDTAERLAELKRSIEKAEAAVKVLKGQFTTQSMVMLELLEAHNIDSVKMHGFTFYTQISESVKTPKTLEQKRELFDYLRDKGLFEEMVGVNSQTLNSFYKAMSAQAAELGDLDFRMPGVEEPTPFTELRLRKI